MPTRRPAPQSITRRSMFVARFAEGCHSGDVGSRPERLRYPAVMHRTNLAAAFDRPGRKRLWRARIRSAMVAATVRHASLVFGASASKTIGPPSTCEGSKGTATATAVCLTRRSRRAVSRPTRKGGEHRARRPECASGSPGSSGWYPSVRQRGEEVHRRPVVRVVRPACPSASAIDLINNH